MRNTLLTALMTLYAAGTINGAHVTACRSKDPDAKACLCTYLGYPPPEKRVKTDQRAEILADWKLQDSVEGDKGSKYLAACEKRRAERLRPHADMLRRVVFTKHFNFGGSHYAYTEGQSDAQHEHHFQPGSSLCLLETDGIYSKMTVLLDDPGGVIRDPDVSHDAKRVIFAWKKSYHKDDYHLYEMDLKTRKVRQLTFGLGYADYEPVYTPDGNIVFSSTRCVQTVDCWFVEVSNLYTCDKDGKYIRRLGFDQVHTTLPTLTEDGRVIYTRWDYNDRGQMAVQSIFQMNPDGTNQRELYGNNSVFPTTVLHTRLIPGTGKYVGIASGHHTRQRGWLAIIDPRKGRQEARGVQLIAPVRDTAAVTVDQYGQTGDQYQYPYPLGKDAFLVGLRVSSIKRRVWSIYFVTKDGARELLYRDHNISCNQPIPVRARSIPRRASTVDYSKKTGTIYLHDIYAGPGLKGVKRGAIKQLRVIGLEFRSTGAGPDKSLVPEGLRLGGANRGPISGARVSCPISVGGGSWDVKKVFGNATVYEDGSACFEAPAREPIFFQALDAQGQMVQSMRSWMTLQPGEAVSCVGCHERKNEAPPVPYFSKALTAGAETLDRKPLTGPVRGFDFKREIQPILDKHCIKCHKLGKKETAAEGKKEAFSLSWPASYNALADRKICNWINAQSKPPMLPPYYTGAAQSKLIKMLQGGKHTIYPPAKYKSTEVTPITIDGPKHNKTNLSDTEMRKLMIWIDLAVPALGDYAVSKDNRYLVKRRKWQAREAENIRQYVKSLDR